MHINPVYPWHCGASRQNVITNQDLVDYQTTTNEKDVDCPDCLAKKKELEGINLNHHPLAAFFIKVAEEYDKSIVNYPLWETKSDEWQRDAVKGEFLEVEAAGLKTKTTGDPTREIGELPQAGNVCGKRFIELTRKK